jgi:cellulose synthase/poly-beta-1,6-N-acetylglucosamine synthase-like glycosyltransferase
MSGHNLSVYISVLLSFCAGVYLIHIICYIIGLLRLDYVRNKVLLSVTVIVPARNEEQNIPACLESLIAQNYPKSLYEVIVVNDNSGDSTESIVQGIAESAANLSLINLPRDDNFQYGKKTAISHGIGQSAYDIILTTDADCIAPKNWIRTMVSHFNPDVGIVSGPVMIGRRHEKRIFHRIQALEFLSLVLAGAGSIGIGHPRIANGANFGYRKDLFEKLNGFEGIDRLRSGDDDLFMQKVVRESELAVSFARDREAIITTKPQPDIQSFMNQRIRWASKSVHYQSMLFIIYLISVYLFYLGLFLFPPAAFLFSTLPVLPIILFILKLIADSALLCTGTAILGRRDLLIYLLPTALFQIIYVLIAGALGLRGRYIWKGR